MTQLQDLCRDAKEQMKLTAQEIADETGVPLSTVNNFFSSASKQPSIHTAGPICKMLGVSLDSFYGIAPSEQELHDLADDLQTKLHDLELENTRLAAENNLLLTQQQENISFTRSNRRNSLILLVFNTVLTFALLCYLIIDANIRNAGLIQFGEPSAAAYALIGLSVLSVAVIVVGIVTIVRKKYK